MGNKRFDRERILQFIKDGWHFRIKVVKGREYLTRRKGQVERSLGPFDQKLWNLIVQLVDQSKPIKKVHVTQIDSKSEFEIKTEDKSSEKPDRVRALEYWEKKQRELEEKISLHRGVVMMTSCKNRDNEGYCNYWNWKNKPRFFMILDELYGEKSSRRKLMRAEKKMVDKWVVWAYQWYCSSCSAYSLRVNE